MRPSDNGRDPWKAPGQGLYSPGANMAPQAQAEVNPYDAFIATLKGISPYDASGDISSGFNAKLKSIADQYNIGVGQLGQQNQAGGTEIANAYADVQKNMGANNADYNGRQDYINAQIANQLKTGQADAGARAATVAADLQGQGNSGSGANAAAAATQGMLATQNSLQSDLSQRLAQVQGQSQNNSSNSAALVNQGAKGTLANNYSLMLAKIAAEKAQQEGDVGSQQASAMASAKASAANQRNDLLMKIAEATQQRDQYNSPDEVMKRQLALQGAGLDNQGKALDIANAQSKAKTSVDPQTIGAYSPIARAALAESGMNPTDAVQTLASKRAMGQLGDMSEGAFNSYVQELLQGSPMGHPYAKDGWDPNTMETDANGNAIWKVPSDQSAPAAASNGGQSKLASLLGLWGDASGVKRGAQGAQKYLSWLAS